MSNLTESTGSNGLRRRIEIEREKSNIRMADEKIAEINDIKAKTRSKHKLAAMDQRINELNGLKNRCKRDMERSERELKNKGANSKKLIDMYGEKYGVELAQRANETDKGVAESMMRKHKKSQNESANLAVLLTEAALLLNDED